MQNEFLVLGDLGENKYIVRMFVGDLAYDQEFTSDISALKEAVLNRMNQLEANPDPELEVEASRPSPMQMTGHAVEGIE